MEMGSVLQENKPDDLDAVAAINDGVLPRDILHEVFLRLPANVLRRLRLVCRSWRSLTSDPSFTKAHSSRHLLVAGLHANGDQIHIADLSGNIIKRILIASPRFRCSQEDDVSTHLDTICVSRFNKPSFVLRKATGEAAIMLPKLFGFYRQSCILAHVPSTGEYKVLRIATHIENHSFFQTSYVTTLNGGSGGDDSGGWRVGPRLAVPVDPRFRHRAAIGGVAYFLLGVFWTEHRNHADMEPNSIASFDLETEEWKTTMIRGPLGGTMAAGDMTGGYMDNRLKFQLTELSGSLVMVHTKCEERLVDVWFAVDLGEGTWSKRYSLNCASDAVHCRFLYPIAVLEDGRIVAWMDFERAMRTYDPRTSTWATAMVTGEKYVVVGTYVGSLLCS